MSEYHVVEVIFKDESVLLQSLKDMGYEAQVHESPVEVGNGRYGKVGSKCHIVVKRGQFNGFGDVGFERTAKGFVMHADDYDAGTHGKRFGLGTLNKKYVENKLKRYVNTTASINIFSRNENEKGQVEIQLRLT